MSLVRIDLHGKLGDLRHMHQGLYFLNLRQCFLKNSDLAELIGSCHHSTLKELVLTWNNLTYDEDHKNLIKLCENLTNIEMLHLQTCDISTWPSNEIVLLFDSFKTMPNMIYLDISRNAFHASTIKYVISLKENSSLRYIRYSLPQHLVDQYQLNSVIANIVSESFHSHINERLNENRSQLLYVEIV